MGRQFRIAIVGTGRIGATQHLPAALQAPGVEVAALVDPAIDRARQLAQQYRIKPRLAPNIEHVLDGIDGAVIATPNHTHAEVAQACLASGVAVLIEKPLATTLEEGGQIVDAADKYGVVAAVAYCKRFRESVVLMRELLQSGYFGSPKRFVYQQGSRGGWAPVSGYNLDRKSSGGGITIMTGSHFLDRLLYWFGDPDDYAYQDDSLGGPESNAMATFHYTMGPAPLEGVARFSNSVVLKPGFVMEAEKGTVILLEQPGAPIRFRPKHEPGLEIIVQRKDGPRFAPGKSRFLLQLEDFVQACTTGDKPMVSARQGLESLRLVASLYAKRRPLRSNGDDSAQR